MIDAETLEWGRECFVAGDGVAAIAEASDHDEAAWRRALGVRPPALDDPNHTRDLWIIALWQEGWSSRMIGDETGMSRQAVCDVARKMRLQGYAVERRPMFWRSPFTPPSAPKSLTLSSRNQLILKKWAAGESATPIAKSVGCTRNAVLAVVHRAGAQRYLNLKPSLRALAA